MDIRKAFFDLQNGNDVRGVAIATEKEKLSLTPDMVSYIAEAFACFISEKLGKKVSDLKIGVGRDSRTTGEMISSACILALYPAKMYDCGIASTPAMFRSTVMEESDFDAAIMLTASHLPFNRNGMKFFTKEGALEKREMTEVLEKAVSLASERGADEGSLKYHLAQGPEPNEYGAESFDIVDAYSRKMRELILEQSGGDSDKPLEGLHIVVDAGNGAAGFFPEKILAPLGADVSGSILLEPDGMFPGHVPNPEDSSAMEAISQAVINSNADLGVIFDCDGDRAAVVFSGGRAANRNVLIALLAAIVKEESPGSVIVTDSVTSDELQDFLENELGLKHLRYKRGYKNVINKGIELNAQGEVCELAIETSGHGAFRENYFSDDGAYICVKIISRMALMRREGKEISELIEKLAEPAESIELRYRIVDEEGDMRSFGDYGSYVLEAFEDFAKRDERFHIVEPNYEGIRIAFDDNEVKGWLLLRKSLHDPVLPMNIESRDAGGTDIIKGRIEAFFSSFTRLKQ